MFKLAVSVLCGTFLFTLVACLPTGGDSSQQKTAGHEVRDLQELLAGEFAQQIGRPESAPVINVAIQILSEVIRSAAIGICPSEAVQERAGRCGSFRANRMCRRSVTSDLEREIVELILRTQQTESGMGQAQSNSAEQNQQANALSASQEQAPLDEQLAQALVEDDQRLPQSSVTQIHETIRATLAVLDSVASEVCPSETAERAGRCGPGGFKGGRVCK